MDERFITEESEIAEEEFIAHHAHWGESALLAAVHSTPPPYEAINASRIEVLFSVDKPKRGVRKLLLKCALVAFALGVFVSAVVFIPGRRAGETLLKWAGRGDRLSDSDRRAADTPDPPSPTAAKAAANVANTYESAFWTFVRTGGRDAHVPDPVYHSSVETLPLSSSTQSGSRLQFLSADSFFCLRRALSRVVEASRLPMNLRMLQEFFQQQSLSTIQERQFVRSTEELLCHLVVYERTKLDRLTVGQAFVVLRRRFVAFSTLDEALRILGEPRSGAWWRQLTYCVPHEYSLPTTDEAAEETQQDAGVRQLVSRLSTAVGCLKQGLYGVDEELWGDLAKHLRSQTKRKGAAKERRGYDQGVVEQQ